MSAIIETRNLTKVFPPRVVALDSVNATFEAAKIHAIVGENGAGKSTLMKVLYALEHPDAGEVFFRGRPMEHTTPAGAIARGLGMVHQEILLVTEYSVWENVILGAEPVTRLGRLDTVAAKQQVARRIEEFGFDLDPEAPTRELSVAARQKVEILKLLYRDVDILILDEPTAVLTPQEVPQLFAELQRLRDAGKTILFVSHHLDEVLELSDRVAVMRKGRLVDTVQAAATTRDELATLMVGRTVLFTHRRKVQSPGDPIFRALGLSYRDRNGVLRLSDVDLEVRAGEILGIAGVEGNGQYELVNSIMGSITLDRGRITVAEEEITSLTILNRRKWISYVSQDRARQGASVSDSVRDNARMTHHRLNRSFTKFGNWILDDRAATRFVTAVAEGFRVVMGGSEVPFSSLSGGNQQKVILGRELMLETPFVLLDQPTRGLDVGSIEYVHNTILDLRSRGRAVLLISADLEELFRLADRIAVIYRGEITLQTPTDETTVEEVGLAMLKGRPGGEER